MTSGGCPFGGGAPAPGVSRRGLIGRAAAAAGAVAAGAAAAAVGVDVAHADGADGADGATTAPAPAGEVVYPFEGAHQQGILTPKQRQAAYVAFDVTAGNAGQLKGLLQILTDQIRFLMAGGTPPDAGLLATNPDNGILGPVVPADGLTVTVSVGSSLFDGRFGLSKAKPAHLRQMDEFPNDALERSICDGDLLLQICADNADTVVHALRQITRNTRGDMQVRWRCDGFDSPPRPSGTSRNLLGYKDGTGNPPTTDDALMDQLIWTHAGGKEPTWVEGGSYHVVRLIRMFVEFWDRVSVREQDNIFGREKITGAPLTGTNEFDVPDYTADSTEDVILGNAHIRLANPRLGPTTDRQRILRRSFNYDLGTDASGDLNMGHLFTAFNQDLDRQFVAIQKRLVDEPLVDYVSPVGGGYFFALPGVQGSSDWLGRGMFA